MCNNKNSPPTIPDLEGSSMISKESTTVVSLRPARKKTRTKTRKPKFLSLRLELSSDNSQDSGEPTTSNHHHHHHQLNLFPLHPENLVEDKDMHDENMAYLFAAADGGATLNGLLGGDAGAAVPSEDSLSPSLTYAYGGRQESEEGASTLVRTALRNRERDAREEKWVCYSEVVEKKEEEVSSCAADLWYKTQPQGLSLKLDYEEILNAWSGKGPLFLDGESPQTVPDLANVAGDGWSGVWRVPEIGGRGRGRGRGSSMRMEDGGDKEGSKMEQRLASVLRYKEKRQSRLFSKRIRYEVRKLNAEKRPRMKGRFVKRS